MSHRPASLRKLDAIYAALPTVECKGLCGHTNCGPVLCQKIENQNIREATGEPLQRPLVGMTCPHLSGEGRCKIYEVRPLICRLFGVVDERVMKCPHGCEPKRWMSDEEATAVFREVERLS